MTEYHWLDKAEELVATLYYDTSQRTEIPTLAEVQAVKSEVKELASNAGARERSLILEFIECFV